MTKEELVAALRRLAAGGAKDPEVDHSEAEDLLLRYIADDDVTDAFNAIPKWYA